MCAGGYDAANHLKRSYWHNCNSGSSHEGTQHMSGKIAVLGAGAIGSSISADLTKAGLDLTVIDQ